MINAHARVQYKFGGEMAASSSFEFSSCVRGHHIYKDIWSPVLGEELECTRESDNSSDPYAVAVKKASAIVGHIPKRISAASSQRMAL